MVLRQYFDKVVSVNTVLEGHSQLTHMRIRYHLIAY